MWLAGALLATIGCIVLAGFGFTPTVFGTQWRVLYFAVLCLGSFFIVWGPGLVYASYFRGWPHASVLVPALVILFSSLTGWLVFWAWFISPVVGMLTSAGFLGLTVIGFLRRQSSLFTPEISAPLIFSLLISVFYLCVAGDRGHLEEGGIQIAHRYWVSVDNVIPKLFADNLLVNRNELLTNTFGDWKFSDRPPLQTGMILLLYGFADPSVRQPIYVVLGLVVNSLWILGLWAFLRTLKLDERRIALIVLTTATVGAIYINTIYAWPKMLAAALSFSVAIILMVRGLPVKFSSAVAGCAAALAMLAHGGAAFGLIGFVFIAIPSLREWRIKGVLIGIVVAACTYVPWMAYQKVFDPPGDRLVKWHLAGTAIDRVDERPPARAIIERYSEEGFRGTVANKITNLRTLLGIPSHWAALSSQPAWDNELTGKIRQYLSQFLGPSPGLLLLGIFMLPFVKRVRREFWVAPVFSIITVSSFAYVLIEFGAPGAASAWLHTAPYTLLLLWTSAGVIVLTGLRKFWSTAIIAFSFSTFYMLWMHEFPVKSALTKAEMGEIDLGMSFGALAAVIAMAVLALRTRNFAENSGSLGILAPQAKNTILKDK